MAKFVGGSKPKQAGSRPESLGGDCVVPEAETSKFSIFQEGKGLRGGWDIVQRPKGGHGEAVEVAERPAWVLPVLRTSNPAA
jgi:hypothetical protein